MTANYKDSNLLRPISDSGSVVFGRNILRYDLELGQYMQPQMNNRKQDSPVTL